MRHHICPMMYLEKKDTEDWQVGGHAHFRDEPQHQLPTCVCLRVCVRARVRVRVRVHVYVRVRVRVRVRVHI